MTKTVSLVWFRRDLRLSDNPALAAALRGGDPVIGLYILDDQTLFAPGGAQKWFLHHALNSLAAGLGRTGVPLLLRRGREAACLIATVREIGAARVYWNRRYAPAEIETDRAIKGALTGAAIEAQSFSASLLREPWEIATKAGGPYRVFTPFWNALRMLGPARTECAAPAPAQQPSEPADFTVELQNLDLLPRNPDWAAAFGGEWRPSEAGAAAALAAFLDGPLSTYAADRDRPDRRGTSRLSPHLALGVISPLTVWNSTLAAVEGGAMTVSNAEKFLSELAWREFAYHLFYHFPTMASAPLRPEFERFPWREDPAAFDAWAHGRTGVPIVDAGMRELWRAGYMHNRVRMIAASFLTKNLLIDWRKGERWFWDTLVDADPANNSASWQWVAGCGADAAPYFRIFNPVSQGEKFDPNGDYVRANVAEIAALPNEFIHAPWTAPQAVLDRAGVRLGEVYPRPIVDLRQSRERALAAYDSVRSRSSLETGPVNA
ncbi:MAG: deoxyribodipyrimidine photo-lyase [Parvularculaceae bacterium]|nr:deoxyribodipyrimidine photo-lyase [Parvularculaceae bacterium]